MKIIVIDELDDGKAPSYPPCLSIDIDKECPVCNGPLVIRRDPTTGDIRFRGCKNSDPRHWEMASTPLGSNLLDSIE